MTITTRTDKLIGLVNQHEPTVIRNDAYSYGDVLSRESPMVYHRNEEVLFTYWEYTSMYSYVIRPFVAYAWYAAMVQHNLTTLDFRFGFNYSGDTYFRDFLNYLEIRVPYKSPATLFYVDLFDIDRLNKLVKHDKRG